MIVLATSGRPIHNKVGRWHFLANFLGGGIAGNLAMWLHYIIRKRRLQNMPFLPPNSWSIVANTAIGNSLGEGKEKILGSTFDSLNSMSCIGCSASVSAVVSFQACIATETIITRIKQIIRRNTPYRLADPATIEEDFHLIYDLTQIFLACVMLWTDLEAMFGNSSSKTGFFDNLFAYTIDRIGHGGHLGGFSFGILYYFVWRRLFNGWTVA